MEIQESTQDLIKICYSIILALICIGGFIYSMYKPKKKKKA